MQRWFRNLPLRHKFALIGLAFLAAMLPPEVGVLSKNLDEIAFSTKERAGLPPAQALLRLTSETQKHRGLTAMAFGGDASARGKLPAQRAAVGDALASAEAEAATAGFRGDGLRQALRQYAGEWSALADGLRTGSVDANQSFERHTALVGLAIGALDAVSNESGLALEPDADTFYVVQASLERLPLLIETLAQVRGEGAGLLARAPAGPVDSDPARARLQVLAHVLTDRSRSAQESLGRAMTGNASFGAALKDTLAKASASTHAVLETVGRELVGKAKPTLGAERFFADLSAVITTYADIQARAFGSLASTIDARIDRQRFAFWRNVTMTLLMTGLALFGLVSITRQVVGSIDAAVAAAAAIGAGDLTHPIDARSRDETGRLLGALASLQQALSTVVGSVRGNAESVATASAQISSGNNDLARRTESQASALQQTSSAMEELGSTVQQNAAGAMQANQLAIAAAGVASRGGEVMQDAVRTMHTIQESSRRIADITSTIDGIAFQTNILALNASVEAARAGEEGRGFAVVAAEVRNLAQRAAQAAREIKGLIASSVEGIERGSAQVDDAGRTMQEVVDQIRRVTDVVGEISSASSEQNTGVGQVAEAIAQMDQTTQQNAALVEESAAAAESLRQQAEALVDSVSVFRLRG